MPWLGPRASEPVCSALHCGRTHGEDVTGPGAVTACIETTKHTKKQPTAQKRSSGGALVLCFGMLHPSRPPPLLRSHVRRRSSALCFLPALQFFPRHSEPSQLIPDVLACPAFFSLPPPQLAEEAGLLFRARCWNQYGQEGGLLAGQGDQGDQRGLREYDTNEAVWALRFSFSH